MPDFSIACASTSPFRRANSRSTRIEQRALRASGVLCRPGAPDVHGKPTAARAKIVLETLYHLAPSDDGRPSHWSARSGRRRIGDELCSAQPAFVVDDQLVTCGSRTRRDAFNPETAPMAPGR